LKLYLWQKNDTIFDTFFSLDINPRKMHLKIFMNVVDIVLLWTKTIL
jgi:hypothetical protein